MDISHYTVNDKTVCDSLYEHQKNTENTKKIKTCRNLEPQAN